MHFFISAGEASGDIHAADLIAELRKAAPDATFTFLGGDLMAAAAGHAPLTHYREMAYMGFAEVLRHLPTIAQILNKAREAINRERPDALILIDYPSFNLKLAKYAKTVLGIPVFYYISPKVWAWKEYRVKEMRRYCDKVLSILPFEVDYFRDKQLDVEYVGNPSVAEVERKKANMMSRGEMNMRFGLDGNRPLLALIPGSRKGEIRGNLPFMVETALNFPQLQPVVAAAPSMPISFYRELQIPKLNHIPIIENATFELMAHSEVALVTSGTATLECALLETPQVVCYRSSGKKWFYNLMSHVLKCPHISLPNLIANGLRGERYANEVVPELLMHHCNTAEMTAHLGNLLSGKPGREQMLNGYRRMKSQLTASSAPARAAASILASLRH
jgi:lipid-A-disaccharide synthase